MPLEIDDLEPFFGVDVTAELCGVSRRRLYDFLLKHGADFPEHYHHDGVESGHGRRLFFRSEVVEIRNRMLGRQLNSRDKARNHRKNRKRDAPDRLKRTLYFEKPGALFFLTP